jgi:hypothetical protein
MKMIALTFWIVILFFIKCGAADLRLPNRDIFVTTNNIDIKTKLDDFDKTHRDVKDINRSLPTLNISVEDLLFPCPISYGKCKYRLGLKTNCNIKFAKVEDKGKVLYVIDCGELSENTYVYHDINDLCRLTYSMWEPGYLYILVDNNVEVKMPIYAPCGECLPSDQEYQISADAFDSIGINQYFIYLDSLQPPRSVTKGIDIFPNCTLINITGKEESPRPKPDFVFDVLEDSSWVSLVLLNSENRYVRLFFHTRLQKGKYFMYFGRHDELGRPLIDGEYTFLLRLNNMNFFTKFHLGE